MEITGTVVLFLVLNSTVNKHHIRRVQLFRAYGTKRQACEEMCEFLDANPDVTRANLEFQWRVQAEHMTLDEVAAFRKPQKLK